MSTEGDLQAILAPLVGGRCYPIVNTSQTITYPYITFQVISNIPDMNLEGPSGLEYNRVQIDIFATTYGAAKTLKGLVKNALQAAADEDFADRLHNVCLFVMDEYEEETSSYREILEYGIWSD